MKRTQEPDQTVIIAELRGTGREFFRMRPKTPSEHWLLTNPLISKIIATGMKRKHIASKNRTNKGFRLPSTLSVRLNLVATTISPDEGTTRIVLEQVRMVANVVKTHLGAITMKHQEPI